MAKRYGQDCPVAKSLDVVGERWTLLVVRDLLRGLGRFQALRRSLPGIPPKLLSERLKEMERKGLIVSKLYSDHPPRAEYSLTDRGRELGLIISALATWGARETRRQAGPRHLDCGHLLQLVHYCPKCRARVDDRVILMPRDRAGAPAAHDSSSSRKYATAR